MRFQVASTEMLAKAPPAVALPAEADAADAGADAARIGSVRARADARWARPCPHLRQSWAHPSHICARTLLAPATYAPGLGSPTHWARPCHTVPGLGQILPRLHRDRARPLSLLRQDWGEPLPHLHRDLQVEAAVAALRAELQAKLACLEAQVPVDART